MRRLILLTIYSLLCLTFLSACSSLPGGKPEQMPPPAAPKANYSGDVNTRLDQHFSAWRGTPYRMGGLNRKGIDCSGFVFITYRDVFGVSMPRSTDQQTNIGRAIPREQLQFGDLVVFKTGFKQKHVGVYVGNGKFLHASTSKGVIKSNIRSEYWSDAYRESRRIVNL